MHTYDMNQNESTAYITVLQMQQHIKTDL